MEPFGVSFRDMKIITFSGIDGSGKSTQLALLRTRLEADGKRVAYFHAVAYSLPQAAKSLFQRGAKKPGIAKAVTKSSLLGVWLRQGVLLLDLVRFRRYVKDLRHEGIEYLLSDRYFYDSLVNIAYLDGTPLDTPYARFAARFIPKPDKAFFLSVSPDIVMRRERAPEQGLQYLRDKHELFTEAASLWDFVMIDAGQDQDNVTTSIKSAL